MVTRTLAGRIRRIDTRARRASRTVVGMVANVVAAIAFGIAAFVSVALLGKRDREAEGGEL